MVGSQATVDFMSRIVVHRRSLTGLCLGPVLALTVCACAGPPGVVGDDVDHGSEQRSAASRSVVTIDAVEVTETGLGLVVDSCQGKPTAQVVESDSKVTITVSADIFEVGPACQDYLAVPLDKDLGARTVVDGSTHSEVPFDLS